MTRNFTAILLGIATLLAARPAVAQATGPQFTFRVPVRLEGLAPEINGYSVSCGVTAGLGSGYMANGRTFVGPTDDQRIVRGSVNTTVVVTVTVNTLINDPALATEYACSLNLTGPAAPGSPTPTVGISYLDDSNTRFPLAAGAPFRQRTRAPIPR